MPLILPNDFVNGEIADAVPVQNNYDLIQGYINSEVITSDGLTQMQAPLLLAGDPTQKNHAANKDYVDGQMPIGTMLMWPAADAPAGHWHLCDGGSLSTSVYSVLFGRVGYLYGGSGGAFLLPNLKGRFPIGQDTSAPAFNVIGESGGTFTVPVPPHAHAFSHTHPMPHTHEHPHTHNVDPANVATSNPIQGHRHDLSMRQNSTPGATGSVMTASATGTTVAAFTGNDDTVHTHYVNIPSTVTGQPSDATTGASSAGNTGQTSVAGALTSNNTVATGPAGGSINPSMVQPYVVINFIIRII